MTLTDHSQIRAPVKRVSVLALTVLLGCASASPPVETGPAIDAGETAAMAVSFSAEQAERGRLDFGILCGECHGTSQFRGTDFQFRWRRQTAWDFYRVVTTTMPESAPGALTDREYVDIISYILELNGYAAGEGELTATEADLDQLPMDGGTP